MASSLEKSSKQSDENPARPVPILTYHSIDESRSVISVAPADFATQMRILASRGFEAISVSRLLDGWEERVKLPDRPIVLTFDDAFRNVMEHAAPVLDELGFEATVFVINQYCGGISDWPNQMKGIPRMPILSWPELSELAAGRVFEIGAHSLSHRRLTGLTDADLEREIVDSRKGIEDRLGLEVQAFAYPFGILDERSRELVRAHYRSACSTEFRVAQPGDDLTTLPRLDAYYYRNPRIFRLLDTVPGEFYFRLRALSRGLRSALSR